MIYDFNKDGKNNNNNNNEKINRNFVTYDRRHVYIQLREAVPATRTPSSPGPRLLSGDCGAHTVETRSTARTIPQFMGPHCSPPRALLRKQGPGPRRCPAEACCCLLYAAGSQQQSTAHTRLARRQPGSRPCGAWLWLHSLAARRAVAVYIPDARAR